jgi:SAM-dependent methyltransferase
MPPPSLASDGRTVARPLHKVGCSRCGLVRNGDAYAGEELARHYATDYALARRGARAEPLLFGAGPPIARSTALARWIAEGVGRVPGSAAEVGCGEGSVLVALRDLWPTTSLSGVDLSSDAVAAARGRGLLVSVGTAEDLRGSHDVVFSVAVVEHVSDPAAFLRELAARCAPGGVVVSIQPHQDEPSLDVFFSDHLHHFTMAHVAAVGAAAGLEEVSRVSGNPLLPGFSRHVFAPGQPSLDLPRGSGAVAEAVTGWRRAFDYLDAWLSSIGDRAVALWGAGQTADALATYSALGDKGIDVVLDDNPARFADGWRGSSVQTFESSDLSGPAWAVLLAFDPPASVIERLSSRGIECYYSVGPHA